MGVRLVHDPVQTGWLPADMLDDLDGAEARGVALRRWVEADAPVLRKLLEDPQVWRLLPEGYPGSLSEADALALIDLANHAAHHDVRAIVEGGVPVGQVRRVLETGAVGY